MRGVARASVGATALLAPGILLLSLTVAGAQADARATHQPAVAPLAVNMVIVPGLHLGRDGRRHDSYTPTNIAARAGQQVVVTVYNYDGGGHTFTSAGLHLNVAIAAAARVGLPATTTFSFTARRPGTYSWRCQHPCDDAAKGWAMAHMGYMAGIVTVTRA